MRSTRSLPIVLAAVLGGCSDPPEPPPPSGTLVLSFAHRLDDRALELGEIYETPYGQRISFDHLRYWVSRIQLTAGDETVTVPSSYYLVEHTDDRTRTTVEVGGVPVGTYDGFAFHVGVDPGPNGSLDQMAGELRPGIGMDWSWDTGYKFFRAEGGFEQADVSGEFVMHVGNDVLYKRLAASLPTELTVEDDGRVELTVDAEIDRLFAGVELDEEPVIQGGVLDSPAGKIAANYARMFTLVTPEGEVKMDGSSVNLDDDDTSIPSDGTPPSLVEPPLALPGALSCGAVPSGPERACMTPFVLGSMNAYQDAGHFTFVVGNGAPVHSSSPGIVADVTYLEHSGITHSDAYLVAVAGNEDAAFRVEYRNLKNLAVAEGDTVEAGQLLGEAGDYVDAAFGSVSLSVVREQELTQRLCPTRYTSSSLLAIFDEALAVSNDAFPELTQETLCSSPSLVCQGGGCDLPGDFVPAMGDVDSGRRIYAEACASCHGPAGEGDSAPALCTGPGCPCVDCVDHATLAASIAFDMPPEGVCEGGCADDVAAFILHELVVP